MNKELEKKIEERKEEAERKNLELKADTIARYLGHGHDNPGCHGREDCRFEFKNENFLITHEYLADYGSDGMSGGGGNSIIYKGKKVYEDVISPVLNYIPGEWEEEFEKLYRKARKIAVQKAKEEKKRKKEVKTEETKKEKAKWGL